MPDVAVRFQRVCKRFHRGDARGSLGEWLIHQAAWVAGKAPKPRDTHFWALRSVDFSIEPGESVGIIGPNGAGKSTALKLLSRILRPDEGAIRVNGRLAGLIEVGAGFHGDLTGRENIFLNGSILGMSRREILRKFDEIVTFAGLEEFLEMPVKRYSSGMYARLGFAIASHVDADVLLVDEVLSVGDAVFRLRCMERMRELVGRGTTLVFVTHDLEQMQAICTRTIVLDRGEVAYSGSPGDAVGQYLMAVSRSHAERAADIKTTHRIEANARIPSTPDGGTVAESSANARRGATLASFGIQCGGRASSLIHSGSRLSVVLRVDCSIKIERLVAEVNLRSASGQALLSINSGRDGRYFACRPGEQIIELSIDSLPLAAGQYFWNVRLWDADSGRCELDTPYCYPMVIQDKGRACGLIKVSRRWTYDATESRAADACAVLVEARSAANPLQSARPPDHALFLQHHAESVPT